MMLAKRVDQLDPVNKSGTGRLVSMTLADFMVRTAYQMGKTPLLPLFALQLGATETFLGLLVAVSTFTGMICKPIIGFLSDRWGRYIWLIAGTCVFTLIPFLYGQVKTPEHLLAIRLVHGLATAIYGPVTLAYIAEQSSSRRAEHLGYFSLARSASYIVGPAVAGWLLLRLEPVDVFTSIGLMSSLAFVPIGLLPERQNALITAPLSLRQQLRTARLACQRTPEVWFAGGLEAILYIALYAVKTFLPVYALTIGVNVAWVGLCFAAQEATHVLLKPFTGRLGDRIGYRTSIGLGMGVLGLSLLLVSQLPSAWMFLACATGLGTSQAFILPAMLALISTQIDRQHTGAGFGVVGTLRNAGKILGPIVAGVLIQHLGYSAALVLIGLGVLLGGVIGSGRLLGRSGLT